MFGGEEEAIATVPSHMGGLAMFPQDFWNNSTGKMEDQERWLGDQNVVCSPQIADAWKANKVNTRESSQKVPQEEVTTNVAWGSSKHGPRRSIVVKANTEPAKNYHQPRRLPSPPPQYYILFGGEEAAKRIQSSWKRHRNRVCFHESLQKLKKERASEIEKAVRAAEEEAALAKVSATRIQACQRRKMAQDTLKAKRATRQNNSACMLQSCWRRKEAEDSYKKRLKATFLLQCTMRRCLAQQILRTRRDRLVQDTKERGAAITLQSYGRKLLAQKAKSSITQEIFCKMQLVELLLVKEAAAQTLQTYMRMHLCRVRMQHLIIAACVIQSEVRMRKACTAFTSLKLQRCLAALCIQRWFRSIKIKRRQQKLKLDRQSKMEYHAAVKLQSCVRMRINKNDLKKQRRHAAQTAELERSLASVTIQKYARCHACKKQKWRKELVVQWAQNAWRRRKAVDHLRDLQIKQQNRLTKVVLAQSVIRRKAGMRKACVKRQRIIYLSRQAVQIQKMVRGAKGRAQAYDLKIEDRDRQERGRQAAATKIQMAGIRFKCRRRKQRTQAAVIIQKLCRRRLGQKLAQELRKRYRQRFTCGNCGHYEPGGIYCKKCGRRRMRPGTVVKLRSGPGLTETGNPSPSPPLSFKKPCSSGTKCGNPIRSTKTTSVGSQYALGEIQKFKSGPKIEKMYINAVDTLPPVLPPSKGNCDNICNKFTPQICSNDVLQSDKFHVMRQSGSAPSSIGMRSRERAREVKIVHAVKTNEKQMETLRGLKDNLDRRQQAVSMRNDFTCLVGR